MNALQSYSSDDESGGEAPMHKTRKNSDLGTNYDDVGMDISEDSDDEAAQNTTTPARERSRLSTSSSQPSGGPSQPSNPSHGQDLDKIQVEGKESQRSSLQERLLGLASGGGSRSGPDDRGGLRDRRDRSRSKSRERDRTSGRDHQSRGHSGNQTSHSGRGRDGRKGRDDDRKRRDDERRSRRSRSRSRSRDRRRSRSRSRDRRSRSRSRDRRHRSRSRERKRPMDIRKEAQQKLAALKAANPDLTAAELLKRSMEAQVMEVQKQTGITLPSYYNPAAMNPMKFAEQERKKKLLWGNKNKPADNPPGAGASIGACAGAGAGSGGVGVPNIQNQPCNQNQPSFSTNPALRPSPLVGGSGGVGGGSSGQAQLWANTKFSNDRDGKMAEKFRRLMGVKSSEPASTSSKDSAPNNPAKDSGMDLLQKQETMFMSMERQYEMARLATHTHKGFGLGFTSQSFMPK